MAADSPDWQSALDEYGRALLDFEHSFEADPRHCVFAYQLPADLGPLPAELTAIALNLFDRARAVESRVQAAMIEVARQRVAITHARTAMTRNRPNARFVDVQG